MSGDTSSRPSLLHVFSTFKVGGPQIRFAQIANQFGPAFRHVLIAMDGGFDCRARLAADVDIEFIDVVAARRDTLRNTLRFRRTLRTIKPDLLVTYNWGAIEWAMANRPLLARHVHIEDGFGPEEAERQLRRRVWTRRVALRGSTVVLPSRTLLGIATDSWRLDPRRLRHIPNGIDCARYAEWTAAMPRLPWSDRAPVVGTVAGLRGEKNLRRLLHAVKRVSERMPCHLIIVGEGPERASLEALATMLGIAERVFFAGHVADPRAFYSLFDVFALSSDTEQMPYALMEAMAAGLPVAATEVGDVPWMVSRDNLPFVTARADEALAQALKQLLGDPELRLAVGAANRRKARLDYDQRAMFAAYEAIFRNTPAH